MKAAKWMALVACIVGLSIQCGSALAAQPKLWKRCETGSAAGQCLIPRGLATNPSTGDVYVADQNNNRILEFTAWGGFVRGWGWGVKDGSDEFQICTAALSCRSGLSGDGPGQLGSENVQGIAVDSAGNVFVVDRGNYRVEKFSSDGTFLTSFGSQGEGPGQFSNWSPSSFVSIGPSNQVYVGDFGRIEEFNDDGSFQRVLPDPSGLLDGKRIASLVADPTTGDLYVGFQIPLGAGEFSPNVFKLDPTTGAVLNTLEVPIPTALTVAPDGDLFVVAEAQPGLGHAPGIHIDRILRFDPSGKLIEVAAQNPESPGEEGSQANREEFATSTGIATGGACLSEGYDLYVSTGGFGNPSFIRAYGPVPDKTELCPRPAVAPSIDSQYASAVGSVNATVAATINPYFWDDTHYFVEYGTGKCSEGGCTAAQPPSPGALLESGIVEADVTTPGVILTGLRPATTYHYRFVATSGGGGPTVGAERSFSTYPLPQASSSCPLNEAFRTGASASLPDCRAYEMVSPIDKEGGDIHAGSRTDQSTPAGDAMTYSSYRPFSDPVGAPFSSQYLSRRDPSSGWTTSILSPPQEGENLLPIEGTQLFVPFKAFSPDLSIGWNVTYTEPVLGPGGQAGFPNVYRDGLGVGYRACTATKPLDEEGEGPILEGVAMDQEHAVWQIQNRVTAEASTATQSSEHTPIRQVYECSFGGEGEASVRLVSILPDGTPSPEESAIGSPALLLPIAVSKGGGSWLDHAISTDGSRVFWTAAPTLYSGPSTDALYVRVNVPLEQSKISGGKCTQSFKACTYSLSASVGGATARFWGATPSGSEALIAALGGSLKGNLYLYDVEKAIKGEEPKTLVAEKTLGVLGTSEDLSRIYFLSEAAIDGEGTPGQPNLYVYQAGEAPTTTYIATLDAFDTSQTDIPSPVSERPSRHLARVTPDGGTLAFVSSSSALAEQTAGYDNSELGSGRPDAEVYRYSLADHDLACVSCNPSGSAPQGRELGNTGAYEAVYAAAKIAPWASSLYAPRDLSEDGSRLFFESYEPLVPSDTNGKADVYEWESPGTGSCTLADPSYAQSAGGCLNLISSGKGQADSEFIDASADGDDVFFTTSTSLVAQDPGSIDMYDARVGGGFPAPPRPAPGCEGQDCQSPSPAPSDQPPTSSSFVGPGNVRERAPASGKCPKGKRKVEKNGNSQCVKGKAPKHRKHKHGKQTAKKRRVSR